jgi:FtsP/CotA-like multicopper oxidase with cupredoxin domain
MQFVIGIVARTTCIVAVIAAHAGRTVQVAATIVPNDNRVAAGRMKHGVLTVGLEARVGIWQPDGPTGRSISTAAFAEVGKTLETPGPLLRVPVGTEVRATVRNSLAKPMWLYGMGRQRGLSSDSVEIAPGATREVRFRADEPGAYYYAARTERFRVTNRRSEDSQLGGVIIVDPPGARSSRSERIFAITWWHALDSTTVSGQSALGPNGLGFVFNGRSYPDNERLQLTQGDSAHWRFVNMTGVDHPLHLHGFYFRVEAKGDGQRDTLYSAAEQRMAVTEYLLPWETMAMSWSPNRSGNWVFHCHFADHISPRAALDADRTTMHPTPMNHETNHMRGLVLGINVKPRGAVTPAGEVTRTIRLLIRSNSKVYGDYVGYSFAIGGSHEDSDRTVMRVPGPVLDLTRGARVAINIVNQSHEGAAVHWHGIELESYPDGVPGVSGAGKNILPLIEAGDSLTIRFTPPRAGTFIYHSHSNEFQQISSGLYGALIVRAPNERPDPATEKLLLISDGGPLISGNAAAYPPALLNGQRTPDPIELRGGAITRLRLINIRVGFAMQVTLLDGETPTQWQIVAKDGMPATPLQSAGRAATMVIAPGETYDLEIKPQSGAMLSLRYNLTPVDAPPALAQVTTVPVRVR